MIKDNFKRGDKIPNSDFFNAVAKGANLAMDLKKSVLNDTELSHNVLTGHSVVKVVNLTGMMLPRFSVLEIRNPLWRSGDYQDQK